MDSSPSPIMRRHVHRLALGTAQFGLAYGITSGSNEPMPKAEARDVLHAALSAGVGIIDTAPRYGNAEEVLGRLLPPDAQVRIVTKTSVLPPSPSASCLRASLEASLARLRRDTIYALVFHNGEGLFGQQGAALWEAALRLRDEGLVRRVGASLYSAEDIEALLSLGPPDIVQVPFNAIDDRLLLSGHLRRLHDLGVEIHARSIFLQGLLLGPPERAPALKGAETVIRAFQAGAGERGLSPLAACLSAALARPELDALVLGVTSAAELQQILRTCEMLDPVEGTLDPIEIPAFQKELLHPPAWPRSGRQ